VFLRKAIGEVNGSEDQAIGFCVGRTAESLNAGSCIFCESEHPKAWTPAASDFDLPRGWGMGARSRDNWLLRRVLR
jgi:hypothetical protein